jgi:hypothetical protein
VAPSLLAFDGWALAYTPFSPAAIHLLTLLEDPSNPDNFLVFLPAPSIHSLPKRMNGFISAAIHPTGSRLMWEQFKLPQLAARSGAAELHLVTPTPALAARVPMTCSPTQWGSAPDRPASLPDRLRRSLAGGGMAGLRRLDWPADLPVPNTGIPIRVQPVRVHPLFLAAGPILPQPSEFQSIHQPGLPDVDLAAAPFLLYAGPSDPNSLQLLLTGWSWASPALGENVHLVLPNLSGAEREPLTEQISGAVFAPTLVPVQTSTLAALAWLYRQAAAVIQLGPSCPWGDPAALALAAQRPLVALEEPFTADRVGPAAFLVPPDDPRLLGAALVSVTTDESAAEALVNAAHQRVLGWA